MPRIHSALIAAFVFPGTQPVGAQPETDATIHDRRIPTIAPLLKTVTGAAVNISEDEIAPQQRLSAGSGVIVDAAKRYVLTKNHVVKNGMEVTGK